MRRRAAPRHPARGTRAAHDQVLITGGAGFIGSHLADRLLGRGDEVLVIDNFATGAPRHADAARAGLELVEGTIADRDARATSAFARFGPEVVVHAAASYKDPAAWDEDSAHERRRHRERRAGRRAGRRRPPRLLPDRALLRPPARWSSRSRWRTRCGPDELELRDLEDGGRALRPAGLASTGVSFRLANVYGPRNLSGPLPTFFHRLTDDKPCFVMDTRRDFVYVDDLVDLVDAGDRRQRASRAPTTSPRARTSRSRSCSTPRSRRWARARRRGRGARARRGRRVQRSCSTRRATIADFGWRPRPRCGDGVAQAIAYYREHGVEQTFTHLKLPEVRA